MFKNPALAKVLFYAGILIPSLIHVANEVGVVAAQLGAVKIVAAVGTAAAGLGALLRLVQILSGSEVA